MEIIHQLRKLESYFIFSLIMSCIFSLQFLRDLMLWLCLSEEVEIHGPRVRHFLDTIRGSASGLTCSILQVVTETSTVNVAIETETWQIIAGVGNFRFYALLKLYLLKDFISNHPNQVSAPSRAIVAMHEVHFHHYILSLKMNISVLWDIAIIAYSTGLQAYVKSHFPTGPISFCFYFLYGFKSKTGLSDTELIDSEKSQMYPESFLGGLSFMCSFIL